MKVQDNNGQYRITIPKDLVKLLKWKHGTELIFVYEKGKLVIKEIKKK